MSIIEKLTEGIVNRDLKKEGAALLSKWEATGLLEGLDTQASKHNMARLLENQAKELLRESNSMGGNGIEGFASVAFPIVRRVFAGLIANDLVSVQPMSLPSGLIFFLDFVYSDNLGAASSQASRGGNVVDKSIYGTDKVGSQITGGVNIVGQDLQEDQSGPRGMVGYSYSSATGSLNADCTATTDIDVKAIITLDGNLSEDEKKILNYDPDILANTSSDVMVVIDIAEDHFTDADFNNLSSFVFMDVIEGRAAAGNNITEFLNGNDSFNTTDNDAAVDAMKQVRRLTKRIAAGTSLGANLQSAIDSQAACVRTFIMVDSTSPSLSVTDGFNPASSSPVSFAKEFFTYGKKDAYSEKSGGLGAINSFTYPLEGKEDLPEIDIKVDSIAITAQTKKLKAKWTPELGQDLNAYHNLDAEVELTSILSEQIALEIDRELLADLVNGATAATYYWSRSPGLFVNRLTGEELGATAAAPDFTGTVSEWYETLIETINDVSAQIHLKTLRGGANYIVCSPEVANILEFTSGYRANVTADADKGTIGAVKVGSLSRKFDIIVDPYFPRNAILVGRKGGSFLESGYVYAPYVPLQTTPTIFGVEDFVPRKGVMTRYGKKMVRPDMYGLVIVRGLNGEEYSS